MKGFCYIQIWDYALHPVFHTRLTLDSKGERRFKTHKFLPVARFTPENAQIYRKLVGIY